MQIESKLQEQWGSYDRTYQRGKQSCKSQKNNFIQKTKDLGTQTHQ